MAPLSKLALLSLVSLTLQYSLLSIVLHLSLHSSSSPSSTPSSKYHTSSLVFLTELFKILLALFCVYFSKELRPGILDIKRLKWEQQARDELDREIDERPVHPVVDHDHKKDGSHWSTGDQMEKDSKVNGRSSSISAASASSTSNAPGSPPSLSTSPTHQRKSNSTSESPLRISVTAAQSNSAIPAIPFISHPPPSNSSSSNSSSNSHGNPFSLSHSSKSSFHIDQQPHFALIPATPAAPPSPYRIPNTTQLFPTRIPRPVLMSNLGLWDVLDKDSWIVLKSIVWGQGWWKLGIPSALFVFQANAQYIASANLSVPLFQLAYQLKIPATAVFSVLLLNRSLSSQQWFSLFLLTSGVAIVQISSTSDAHAHDKEKSGVNQTLGLAAVLAACASSGFASTYFERVLKAPSVPPPTMSPSSPNLNANSYGGNNNFIPLSGTDEDEEEDRNRHLSVPISPQLSQLQQLPPSLWIRNIQLSLFGLLFTLPLVIYDLKYNSNSPLSKVLETAETGLDLERRAGAGLEWQQAPSSGGIAWVLTNFLTGFRGITWVVLFLQVTGGLLGAIVMQYADNLLKNFATSVSILISAVVSTVLFDFKITPGFVTGAFFVLVSTWAYVTKTTIWKR